VEPTAELREHARGRGLCKVEDGLLPDGIPYAGEKFDLICLFDVMEHVKDDVKTASVLRERLNDGGCLLITVPAGPALWSYHDVENQHFRRYTKKNLRELLGGAGFVVERVSYFNTFLYPAVYLARRIRGGGRKEKSEKSTDLEMKAPCLSWFLHVLMATESVMLSVVNFPFGVSLICTARK
jgi:SAM-dependent methyltransferase